jgi:hypothetical protein
MIVFPPPRTPIATSKAINIRAPYNGRVLECSLQEDRCASFLLSRINLKSTKQSQQNSYLHLEPIFIQSKPTITGNQSQNKLISHIITSSIPIYSRPTPGTGLRSFLNDFRRCSLLGFPLPVVHGFVIELCTCFAIMPVQVVKYASSVTAADTLKDLGLATFVDLPGEASASYAPPEIRYRFYG